MQRAAPTAVSIPTTTANAETMNPLFKDVVFREVFRIPATTPTADLATSLGPAVIADPDGYILTNFHVVNDTDRIQAILHYGRLAEAKIVGGDLVSDIAMLQIKYTGPPRIGIGDFNDAKIADMALAIADPLGVGQTITQGIISTTGRNWVGINTFENFIQTDTVINQGNSGRALLNIDDRRIDINSATRGLGLQYLLVSPSISCSN